MSTKKNTELLSSIEINSTKPAVFSLIWLHGLGASGDDFVPVASELQNLTALPLRFVFPHAPVRPVTINNGYIMPAWYDISSFNQDGLIDHAGISCSVEQIKALIKHEEELGFTTQQIILAGFSQGAVIALHTLLSCQEQLGGVIALSGYLPLMKLPPHTHKTAIFLGHGQADPVVPCIFGQAACEALKQAGYPVSWHSYPMLHSVCEDEISDIAAWLKTLQENK